MLIMTTNAEECWLKLVSTLSGFVCVGAVMAGAVGAGIYLSNHFRALISN